MPKKIADHGVTKNTTTNAHAHCHDCDWHATTGNAQMLAYNHARRHHHTTQSHTVMDAHYDGTHADGLIRGPDQHPTPSARRRREAALTDQQRADRLAHQLDGDTP